MKDKVVGAFLTLVKAGLWEKEVQLSWYDNIDYNEVNRLAKEQSVIGLVAAGLEHVSDKKPPKQVVLQIVVQTLQIEQRNIAMNNFIGIVVDKMRKADIYALLVKGQGVAQCYERPHWRSSGDVDFLLSDNNYEKAIDFLLPLSSDSKNGGRYSKEFALTVNSWMVELHGSLRSGLSGIVDKVLDDVYRDVFCGSNGRSWNNCGTTVFLPAPDNDVFLVFTHFIKHFYKEGMNIRQICDWCRLLWTFRETLDHGLLESWIRKAGLMDEWRAFAALVVDYLGIPKDAMPLYEQSSKWSKKASLLLRHILKGGPRRVVSEIWSIAKVFPWKTMCYLPSIFFNVNGLKFKERLIEK